MDIKRLEQSSTDRVYDAVQDLAARFAFKPGERINEGRLAAQLGTSRTPLREALNRLSAEGFLTFRAGKGFSCRTLNPTDILDLYESRQAIESEAVRLATDRASDSQLRELSDFLEKIEPEYRGTSPANLLVDLDEEFHMRVMELAQNSEMRRILENLNARTRFVRLIDMDDRRKITPEDHRGVVNAMAARDVETASQNMREHIRRRREEATVAAQKAFSRLYVPI